MSFDPCNRPRNAAATRAAILDAATTRFLADSYDQVGMRDIARDVGVDPALISRYFGSKEELFVTVIEGCSEGKDLMGGDRSTFGERTAHEIIYGPRTEFKMRWLLLMLRSIGSPKAADIIQKHSNAWFLGPFTDWVGGEDAAIRARLVAGLLMGMSVSRDISSWASLTPEESARMHARLAKILQDLIDN